MAREEYCAYSHLSAMLRRTGVDWLLGMFEVYFDDGGTDSGKPLAIAACYVSTRRGWDQFTIEWDKARVDEDFDCFHMTDFAARAELGKKPFCDWDSIKKRRVYRRLAGIINPNKWVGFGLAIPKDVFDREVPKLPEPIRKKCGNHHFTFAFKCVLNMIERWRKEYSIKIPMRYVFDRMGKGKGEVQEVWTEKENEKYNLRERLGLESDPEFENKCLFKPLQAADILSWQLHDHMRNVILAGKDDVEDCHPHFRMLRLDQHMRLAYMTEENFLATIRRETQIVEVYSENDASSKGETA